MAMTVEGIFLIGQHLTNIDSVHKKLEKELRSLKLESHTKELHIETLLNKNAVSLALIKYLLHGIFLMFERKETLSYDETIQLIELAKLEAIQTELEKALHIVSDDVAALRRQVALVTGALESRNVY